MPKRTLKERFAGSWAFAKDMYTQWTEDQATRQAASLALYTLLSIAPLLIVAIAVAGAVYGEDAARGRIAHEIAQVTGPQAGAAIQAVVANARAPGEGLLSSIIGIGVLLLGASGVFGELQTSLNEIWKVKPKPGRGIRGFLRDRFLSFAMVMGVAFLLLVSLVFSAALSAVVDRFSGIVEIPILWEGVNFFVSLIGATLLFALIYKLVPDAQIAWRDVWVGALATAALFSFGKIGLAWYVGRSATTSAYGAAGSLVALVIWVYYSAQILFLGAEFTCVYATRLGSCVVPKANAVKIRPTIGEDRHSQ